MVIDLQKLNSATKYPSILTYHHLGVRGELTEDVTQFTGPVVLTEKIDGVNSRIIRMPDGDWFIGSREELLTAKGDRVPNPALGIVDAMTSAANVHHVTTHIHRDDVITVLFLETYGSDTKIKESRQYTGSGLTGYRMFDVAFIPPEVLTWSPEKIAGWRDHGGQEFAPESELQRISVEEGLDLVPRLAAVGAGSLPVSVEDTYAWLVETLPRTQAALDDGAGGRPEGIVLRSQDRSVIAKAKFANYERTMRLRGH